MKKFLSLLLALTMVMSLVVVPARAHDGEVTLSATKASIEVGDTSVIVAALGDNTLASGYPKWSLNEGAGASLAAADGNLTATVTGAKAETVTVTCKYKLSADAADAAEKSVSTQITVTAPDCAHAIKSITVNGITSSVVALASTGSMVTVGTPTTLGVRVIVAVPVEEIVPVVFTGMVRVLPAKLISPSPLVKPVLNAIP